MVTFTGLIGRSSRRVPQDEESGDICLQAVTSPPNVNTETLPEEGLQRMNSKQSSCSVSSTSSEHPTVLSRSRRLGGSSLGLTITNRPSSAEPTESSNSPYGADDAQSVSTQTSTNSRLSTQSRDDEIDQTLGNDDEAGLLKETYYTSNPDIEHPSERMSDCDFAQYGAGEPNIEDEALHSRPDLMVRRSYPIRRKIFSWQWLILVFISLYMCAFSAVWFLLSVGQSAYTSWDIVIGPGKWSYSKAVFLASWNSKIIEVGTLGLAGMVYGQICSRQAARPSNGLNLAAVNIRLWLTRPGVLLTHFAATKYAFKTKGMALISVISIITMLAGLFYTTVSNQAVIPRLMPVAMPTYTLDGGQRPYYGMVFSSYANPDFIEDNCETPITQAIDPKYDGSTCMALEYAGDAYYNYNAFGKTWAQIAKNSNGSSDLTDRPPITAQLFGNTTVQGSWIEAQYSNVSQMNLQYGRIINNVTVAMPHSGVISTTGLPENSWYFPPSALGPGGSFSVIAAVPVPALNVLCANADLEEIAPLVYTQWPNAETTHLFAPGFRVPASPLWQDEIPVYSVNEWLNRTSLDDVFGWGEKYDRRPPVFEAVPLDYNTIMNGSIYEGDSTYILLKSPLTSNYTVCSMRAFLYSDCSTEYNVTGAAFGTLQTNCDDPTEEFTYRKMVEDAPITFSRDYPNIVSSWGYAISLNDGAVAGNASNPRELTELIPHLPWLNPTLPSVAEALAALAANTVLQSMIGAPFVHYWSYNETTLETGALQHFNTSVTSSMYISAHSEKWQILMNLILVYVFFANFLMLFYLVAHPIMHTDFTEYENALALGVNTPASNSMVETCAHGDDHAPMEGPMAPMLARPFWVDKDEETGLMHFTAERRETNIEEGPSWLTQPNAATEMGSVTGTTSRSRVGTLRSEATRESLVSNPVVHEPRECV